MSAETRGMTLKEYCIRSRRAELLQHAAIVTCDPCLPERTLLHLLDLCAGHTPVYVDPVSTAYAQVLAPHIGRFHRKAERA